MRQMGSNHGLNEVSLGSTMSNHASIGVESSVECGRIKFRTGSNRERTDSNHGSNRVGS